MSSFLLVLKAELAKIAYKRISLLLLLLFAPSLLFGIGMSLGLSFLASDGGGGSVEVVESALSAVGFAVNMMEQGKYIIFLVVIILAASSLAGEVENGQIKNEILLVCSRTKIMIAKHVALVSVVSVAVLFSVLWSVLIYVVFVDGTEYANGLIFDALLPVHMGYIFFVIVGIGTVVSVTFLLGVKLKLFSCFAVSYIVWFASLYTDFMGKIKLFIPYNMPNAFLEQAGNAEWYQGYIFLYIGYCIMLQIVSCIIFNKAEIKS